MKSFRWVALVVALVVSTLVIPVNVQADSVCDSGATLPANPVIGRTFLHTPTGRTIQYIYTGSNWKAQQSYGTMTVYVDTQGTDNLSYGWGTGANAFRTIQYAWDSIPPYYDGTVTINIGAGTFTENPVFTGKQGAYSLIFIKGAMTQLVSLTATGGTKGAGSVAPSVSGTFTPRQYEGKLLHFTSGSNNGLYRIVGYTTSSRIYLDGQSLNAQPASGDTYEILDWATTILGTTQAYDQGKLRPQFLKLTNTSGLYTFLAWGATDGYLERCWVYNNGPSYGIWVSGAGASWGLNEIYATGSNYLVRVDNNAQIEPTGVKCSGAVVGMIAFNNGVFSGMQGNEISGAVVGQQMLNGGMGGQSHSSLQHSYVHGCSAYGLYVTTGGGFLKSSAFIYGKQLDNSTNDTNGTNELVETQTYGWIGN